VIRILHVASGDLWAGAEAQVYQLVCALAAQPDLRVSAIILNAGELADRLRAAGLAVTMLDERSLTAPQLMRGIGREIKATGADVLHTHRFKENILGSLAARLSGSAISLRTVHGRPEHVQNSSGKHRVVRALDVVSGRLQSGIVGVSEELCDFLRTQFPSRKVFCVPNGINSAQIIQAAAQPGGYEAQRKHNVALIGRLAPVKRVDLFLETAALLVRANPGEYRFVVVGDGPLRDEMTALAQRLDILGDVDFLGFQGNSLGILKQMDCLALTSDNEGLPMVLLEALTLGVPVVAHAVGGLPEVLAGVPGQRLVTEHTPAGYAAAISGLVDKNRPEERPQERQSLLPPRFEISGTASQYADLYRRLARHNKS
jgi:glycosyltransferase involved in cell wall biosynthesis